MYFSQGFYRYSFGNIAYQHNKELVSVIEDLKKLTFDSPKTTLNHSFEQEWQEWRTMEKLKLNQFDKSKGFKPSPYGKNQDLAFSLYRLDYYGTVVRLIFHFHLQIFALHSAFMQDKYETLFQPADIDREIQFQPKKNNHSYWMSRQSILRKRRILENTCNKSFILKNRKNCLLFSCEFIFRKLFCLFLNYFFFKILFSKSF